MSQNTEIIKIGLKNNEIQTFNKNHLLQDLQSPTKTLKGKEIHEQQSAKEESYQPKEISFFNLFKYATITDYFLMIIGTIAAIINGAAFPLFALIFGEMADSFNPSSSGDQIFEAAGKQCLYFLYVGISTFILSWLQMSCWIISGERQSIVFRKKYFQAILKQEIGWFDMINPQELNSKIASETFYIQTAIGENIPTFIMNIIMTLGGFAVGYARGWQMALVCTSALPVLVIGGVAFALTIQLSQKKIASSYSTAGGYAEQSLSAIKTVKSLTGSEHELKNYKRCLIEALKTACKYGIWAGAGLGLTFSTMFLDYALSFWYGSVLVEDQTYNSVFDRNYTQGDVFVVFFAIIIGGFSLGQSTPCIKKFQQGKLAGSKIFDIIERKPLIQVSQNAQTIKNLKGNIIFNNVNFSYPSKKNIQVHKNLNLTIQPNQKTAIFGESGCGKSTIMQLLLRFYDPCSGSISIDGINVKQLDYMWLRRNVGYVSQEPVLFATSIRENLRFGKEDATEEEMIEALKQANAWEFVKDLEKQLDTYVGNAGSQISGGQKQRICIARAILKNPQILLLDEATSALDRKNEAMIQATLDQISKGRTTIIIAHRISTVKNADKILVLDQGQLVEEGTYQTLVNLKGKFEALAKNQIQSLSEDINNDDQEIELKQSIIQNNNNTNNYQYNNSKQNVNKQSNVYEDKNTNDTHNKQKLTKEEIKLNKKLEEGMIKRLYEINKSEKFILYIGVFFSLANGVLFPISGFLLGEFVETLALPFADDYRDRANLLSLSFVILAIGSLVFSTFQQYIFTRVGEGLTLRIRQNLYQKMLDMPCEWFDKEENNPGSLSACLSVDAHKINALTSTTISIQFQSLSSFLTGIICAFTASWRVSLVTLSISPLMAIAGVLQAKFVEGFSENTDAAYKESGIIVMESVTNIRTVASFSNEKIICQMYEEKLKQPYSKIQKKGNIAGITFGFSQFVMFGSYAIIFICAAIFVRDNGVSTKDMFISVYCIMFAAFGAGNNSQFASDIGAAKNACKTIFKILDSEDEIQISQKVNLSLSSQNVFGDIEFKNVSFKYPSRDAQVLQNISFSIKKGQKIAFVGSSGSGKSSILQLIQRFYENYEGQILIDGKDIKSYNIKDYRRNFGVVSQEPVIFNGTIAENITYNTEGVTNEQLQRAAQQASAFNFINLNKYETKDNQEKQYNFGQGFQRKVGLKGSQLSGGQKQRISIARAIIKNPNVLLLDEATSALDNENEKIVQESLNSVMKGRTSLSVAHRISTIKDSDQIFVIESGKLVEQGTYDKLMENKSFFYRLNTN